MNGRGFTLVEILVVLMILGLMTGITGLALASLKAPREAAWVRDLRAARDSAIRTGAPVSVAVAIPDTGGHRSRLTAHVLFLPDGRALGTGVDPLIGTPR